jgi:Flp pilus assembly protein TadD
LRTERGAVTLPYEFHVSREAIEKGVSSFPNDGTWRLQLGQSLILEGDADRAVTELKHALELGVDPVAGKSALAMAYYLRSERAERKAEAETADSLLGEVAANRPDDRTMLFNRALVKERLGDTRSALALWDTVIATETDEGWRKEATERRDKLRRSSN